MKKNLLYFLLLALAFTSCKKDKDNNNTTTTTADQLNLLKDSVYSYAKESYLWNDALPAASTFNPRQFTGSTDVNALQAEIDAFSQYKINPSTSRPYEYNTSSPGTSKYSYIDEGQAATSVGGTGGDAGFSVFYQSPTDLRIRYVYPNSPASVAGIARGYKVTAINGNTSINYDPNISNSANDPNYVFVVNALSANSITLTLLKPDNTTMTATIARGTYTINPVIKYSVITTPTGKKVGYFAFSRFTTLANAQAKIDEAFNSFMAANVSELVVDLRYNGGGSVETSQYIANYIAPASKTGTVMFTETYNSNLQAGNHPMLSRIYRIATGEFSQANNTYNFVKKGTLNLSRTFFIVTGSTASASELLINNLQPALPNGVQIIGRTSYGKPVGFFGIPVGRYDMYIAQFESRNSLGRADFYQGMVPGTNFPGVLANDDVTKDFGDPAEGLLARAINFIEKGNYTVASVATQSLRESSVDQDKLREVNLDLNHDFKGAIHTSGLKRLQQ